MPRIEALQARMSRVESLRSVVRTMKALAMANQHKFNKAQQAASAYSTTVELALQAVLQQQRFSADSAGSLQRCQASPEAPITLMVIFGSDHGLCGPFNEQIVSYASTALRHLARPAQQVRWLLVGARLAPLMPTGVLESSAPLALPVSLSGVPRLLHELIAAIPGSSPDHASGQEEQAERIMLLHHQPAAQASYSPRLIQLLPLDPAWLAELDRRPWASTSRPSTSPAWETLSGEVIDTYVGIGLHRAVVASMASENIARLVAMHAAETNIDERLASLRQEYRQVRQGVITDELLDIVSGFEAMRQQNGKG